MRKRVRGKRYAVLAACLALVITGAGILTGRIPLLGGGSGGTGIALAGGKAPTYLSYDGPVLPFSLAAPNDAITAEREITLDFQPWVPVWTTIEDMLAETTEAERQEQYDWYQEQFPEGGYWKTSDAMLVQDTTTLTNHSHQDQNVTVLYPFTGRISNLTDRMPSLALDEHPLEAGIRTGRISSVLVESQVSGNGAEVSYADSWEEYEALLEDGTYQEKALEPVQTVSGTCILYTIALDGVPDVPDGTIHDPELKLHLRMDYGRTRVFQQECTSVSWDPEGGMELGGYGPIHLLVLGDDIEDLEKECRVLVKDDTWVTLDAEITVERREADAAETLREIAREQYEDLGAEAPFELFYDVFVDNLELCFLHDGGDISIPGWDHMRIFYLTADITIPADGSVCLTAVLEKKGSHNYNSQGRAWWGLEGYDLETRIGSHLDFQGQKAVLENRGQIEIVGQNFGFDLQKGVLEVPLTGEHYWLVVRRASKAD